MAPPSVAVARRLTTEEQTRTLRAMDPLPWSAPPDRAILLLMALAIEAIAGEARGPLRRLPHPVRLLGGMVAWLEQRLNRPHRTDRDRLHRGMLVVVVVGVLAGAAGAVLTRGTVLLPYLWLAELVMVVALLAQRSLYQHVRGVASALSAEGLIGGRRAVAMIVGRDVTVLDEHGVARAAIESCAENFADGVVALAFWYVVLGLPGLLIYKAANTMDSMIGHRSDRYRHFGRAAARLDDALNLIPSRLAGMLLVAAAAAVPGASPRHAMTVMWRDAATHRSPNAGWPEAAMAGALGLALGGPRRYGDDPVAEPWLGDGRAEATVIDIHRALALYVTACVLGAAGIAVIALAASLR